MELLATHISALDTAEYTWTTAGTLFSNPAIVVWLSVRPEQSFSNLRPRSALTARHTRTIQENVTSLFVPGDSQIPAVNFAPPRRVLYPCLSEKQMGLNKSGIPKSPSFLYCASTRRSVRELKAIHRIDSYTNLNKCMVELHKAQSQVFLLGDPASSVKLGSVKCMSKLHRSLLLWSILT